MKKIMLSLAALALSTVSAMSVAAGEIKLIKVDSRSSYYHGFSWETGRFEAQVANLAFAKQVAAHVKKTDGTWYDYPLSYHHSSGSNKEVWAANFETTYSGVNTLPDTGPIIEFSLKYTVNGVTYWDNNGGANYKVTRDAGTYLAPGVNVAYADYAPTVTLSPGQSTWGGRVSVRNIAPTKNVKLHYTTNNWATTQIVDATYVFGSYTSGYSTTPQPNSMGFEEWLFNVNNVYAGAQIKYAISYTVNGQTYWDNNYGLNYTTTFVAN